MNKIKIIDADNSNDFFEIPWNWIDEKGLIPYLNDLDASAERGKTTAYLYRHRMAEIPEYTIRFIKKLKQSQVYPLLRLLRKEKLNVYYFDIWRNQYVTEEFYIPKPKALIDRIPKDNVTNNILIEPFEIVLKGYGGVSN